MKKQIKTIEDQAEKQVKALDNHGKQLVVKKNPYNFKNIFEEIAYKIISWNTEFKWKNWF